MMINHRFWKPKLGLTSHTQAWLLPDLLNHLTRACLTEWSSLKNVKKQHILTQSKEIPQQMRNKVGDSLSVWTVLQSHL